MIRPVVLIAIGSFFAGTTSSACEAAATSKAVQLPGTKLDVSLPPDWEIAPAKPGGFAPIGIHYKRSPGFEVTVTQNDASPHAEAATSLPFECDYMFGALQAAVKFQSLQRPDFVPEEYYSRVLVAAPPNQREVLSTCLYLGNSALALMIRPAPNSGDGARLAPVLRAIADSGRRRSTLLYAPGLLRLRVLGATARMSSGIWAAGTTLLPGLSRKTDLLVRVSGSSELKILPHVSPGTCSLGQLPNHTETPPYVGAKWEPSALEAPAPNGQLTLAVCRQIAPAKMLLVTIEYGSRAVPSSDAIKIAGALDEIAEGVISEQH